MSLRVAVQMDPLEQINISGDSTFALMLKAQERGHELFHYLAEDLTFQDGRLYAGAHQISVQAVAGSHFNLGKFSILDLGRDMDVVLMRQDPPFDLGYITATHLLERIQSETLVVNDPGGVRNAPEKVWVLDFAQYMPPTTVTRSLGAAREFLAQHGEMVLKPLHGNAGKAVFKISRDGANLSALMELFNELSAFEAAPATSGESDVFAVREALESLVLMLAPFSPHIAEEMWQKLGHEGGLLKSARWPRADSELARRDELEIPIQVNGKLRSRLLASPDVTEEQLRSAALNDEKVRHLIDGREVVKVIVVPQRLVNVVVR